MQLQVSEPVGFDAFELRDELSRALVEMGYDQPTDIQRKAIPLLLEGYDVIGQAQTGTGKTAAFGVPIAEMIDEVAFYPQVLVLAPTRELALQISDELSRLTHNLGVRIATIYGGAGMEPQIEALQRGSQIVVGTPGRIIDHLRRGNLKLGSIDLVILDEADRMLDMGFMPDVERILRQTPRDRQTALFSATMPLVIRILARRHLRDPKSIVVKPHQVTVEEVEQVYYEVADQDKPFALLEVLQQEAPERTIIFRRTQAGVDRLTRFLQDRGVKADAIHGSLTQASRERTLKNFRDGSLQILVATNVAARGLDVPEISHVINYDVPEETESYIHRIGRTARMGRDGMAITFVGEWDREAFLEIQKVASGALQPRKLALYTA